MTKGMTFKSKQNSIAEVCAASVAATVETIFKQALPGATIECTHETKPGESVRIFITRLGQPKIAKTLGVEDV